jgi:hypothetical protein
LLAVLWRFSIAPAVGARLFNLYVSAEIAEFPRLFFCLFFLVEGSLCAVVVCEYVCHD